MTSPREPGNIPEAAVELRGLRKGYRKVVALDDLSVLVPRGTITGLIGPNGAGKTTALRVVLGLVRPDRGDGAVLGRPLGTPRAYLGRVGSLVEGPALYPGLSVRRNLAVLAAISGLRGARARTEIDRALELAGVTRQADRPYRTLSAGTRQKAAIAGALLGDPELLVLDEPVNGLDPGSIRNLRELLPALRDAGTTVLLSSHLLGELEQVCDWYVVLSDGRCLAQGSAHDVTGSSGNSLEEHFLQLVRAAQDARAS